jgi:hypothetical protein
MRVISSRRSKGLVSAEAETPDLVVEQPGDAQTFDAVGLDHALPRQEFFHRELVTTASFLETDGAAAHSVDDRGLAPHDPALCVEGRHCDCTSANAR